MEQNREFAIALEDERQTNAQLRNIIIAQTRKINEMVREKKTFLNKIIAPMNAIYEAVAEFTISNTSADNGIDFVEPVCAVAVPPNMTTIIEESQNDQSITNSIEGSTNKMLVVNISRLDLDSVLSLSNNNNKDSRTNSNAQIRTESNISSISAFDGQNDTIISKQNITSVSEHMLENNDSTSSNVNGSLEDGSEINMSASKNFHPTVISTPKESPIAKRRNITVRKRAILNSVKVKIEKENNSNAKTPEPSRVLPKRKAKPNNLQEKSLMNKLRRT